MRITLLFLIFCASLSAADKPYISVSGKAKEVATPDTAEWRFDIYSTAATIDTASAAAQEARIKMMLRAKELKIPDGAIVTEGINQGPLWRYDQGGRKSDGFFSELSFRLKLSDLSTYTAISERFFLDSLIQVRGVSLWSGKKAEAERLAIKEALVDATAKAQAIAAEMKVKVGRVISVSCQNDGPQYTLAGSRVESDASSLPALMPIEVYGNADVVFEITE